LRPDSPDRRGAGAVLVRAARAGAVAAAEEIADIFR
jgi:hypothetical protein